MKVQLGKIPIKPFEYLDRTHSLHTTHTKASPESTTFHKYITLQSLNLIITNQVWNLRKVLEVQIESSSEFTAAEIKQVLNDDIRCHDEARTWHHSALSSLAGVVSHSTDQPGGKTHGQVKLAIWSSNVSPENKVEPQASLSILILSKAYPTRI